MLLYLGKDCGDNCEPEAVDITWLGRSKLRTHHQFRRRGILDAGVHLYFFIFSDGGGDLRKVSNFLHSGHVRVFPVGDLDVPTRVGEARHGRQAAVDDVETVQVFHSGGDVRRHREFEVIIQLEVFVLVQNSLYYFATVQVQVKSCSFQHQRNCEINS